MKRILIVDDEVQIIKSVSRAFFETDYDILTAESGEEALKLLEENEVNLVISDMRMPVMDGYELLSHIKKNYPKVIRVILSGYTDEKIIIKAIIRNVAKVYILKPWNNEELLRCIEQLFLTEDLLNSKNLLLLINSTDELPTIKASYQNLIALIEKDEDIKQIAQEIEKDFALSTKLLHVANSALYGVKTGSVEQASLYLGLQNTRSLILSTAVMSAVTINKCENDLFEYLWRHALLTNKILSYMYQTFFHKKLPESALSAGLLHNIGILVTNKQLTEKYISCRNNCENKERHLLEMELEALGVTHQEVGAYLLSWWELPFPIVEAALFHHRPFDPNIVNIELVMSVHIAQKYAWDIIKEPVLTPFYPEVFEKIGVFQQVFEEKIKEEDWY